MSEQKKIPIETGNGCLFQSKYEGSPDKYTGYLHLPDVPIPYPIIFVDDEGNEHEIPAGTVLKGPEETGGVVTVYIKAYFREKEKGSIIVLDSPNFRTHDPNR